MAWNPRRKGWLKPTRDPAPPVPPKPEVPMPPVAEDAVLIVPVFPSFSQVAIALLLKVARSTVQYWIQSGKLTFYRDNAGELYVLREELVKFLRDYLKMEVKD